MADAEHLEVLQRGVKDWNQWRGANPNVRPDLRGARLARLDLNGIFLFRADLREVDLSGTSLGGLGLFPTVLSEADLSDSNLASAQVRWAEAASVDFSRADLSQAVFSSTNLSGADLSGALMSWTTLSDLDLSMVRGLESVRHLSPSTISFDTISRSRGRIPKAFLRGAGVPKEFLDAIPRLMADVPYYSCFVSYGDPDRPFAERLVSDLGDRGVSCWLYTTDATPGRRTWGEIGQNRRDADKFVVLCSADALVRDGVLKEVEEQIDEDLDRLVPVSLDDLWRHPGFRVMRGNRDLKPFLLDRNYADFKNLAYEEALERLLRGLQRDRTV